MNNTEFMFQGLPLNCAKKVQKITIIFFTSVTGVKHTSWCFLRPWCIALNNFGPATWKLDSLFIRSSGFNEEILHFLNSLSFISLDTYIPEFGTIPSKVFQTYIILWRSSRLCWEFILIIFSFPSMAFHSVLEPWPSNLSATSQVFATLPLLL